MVNSIDYSVYRFTTFTTIYTMKPLIILIKIPRSNGVVNWADGKKVLLQIERSKGVEASQVFHSRVGFETVDRTVRNYAGREKVECMAFL